MIDIIHTIVPIEQVLGANGELSSPKFVRALYMGEDVLLNISKDGDYSINRLLSTNPKSYLKNELMPGTRVDVKKIKFDMYN